jgi:hypothetical protein
MPVKKRENVPAALCSDYAARELRHGEGASLRKDVRTPRGLTAL